MCEKEEWIESEIKQKVGRETGRENGVQEYECK